MFRLILILAACGFAGPNATTLAGFPTAEEPDPKLLLVKSTSIQPDHSLAWSRFREDSTGAERILQDAQLQANLLMGLARRNLQRDTAKAK